MHDQTEQALQDTLREGYNFFASDDEREKAAQARHRELLAAIDKAARQQAEALERGMREIANALRDLARR